MSSAEARLTISTPFGRSKESVVSTRYRWDNERRSDQQYVILQQTLSGKGVFRWEGKAWEVPPGHAFLCLVPESSSYHFPEHGSEPWLFAWLNLYGPLAMSLAGAMREAYGPVLPLSLQSVPGAAFHDLVVQTERRKVRDLCDTTQATFHFLMEWKRLLDRPQVRTQDPVDVVRRICQARFREPLGIKELAAQAGLSREHLTRIFTERTGLSPARHLRDLRTAAARSMLSDPGTTLKETALRCGFPSVKALQRAFAAQA